MFKICCLFTIVMLIALSGCGTYIPEIQEDATTPSKGQLLVKSIVNSIHCELKNSVIDALGKKGIRPNKSQLEGAFMYKWGVQVALVLNIEEKTSLSPVAVLTPPGPTSAIFTLGVGAVGSADATRKDIINFFYTVDELRAENPCAIPNNQEPNAPLDSLLQVQSDLKLEEWLLDSIMLVGTNEIGSPSGAKSILKQNVISHEIKFEVITTGAVTPAWKLTRFNVNQSGSLFSTTRDRTHDLTITFGPLDPAQDNTSLIPLAETLHSTSIFGITVGNAIKSGN